MRRFHLMRKEDVHGKSGTGLVAEGIEFSDGAVVIKWLSQYWGVNVFLNIHEVKHLHGHEGKSRVVWIDKPSIDDIDEVAGSDNANISDVGLTPKL